MKKRYEYWDRDDPGLWSTAMVAGLALVTATLCSCLGGAEMWRKAAILTLCLVLAGCATRPCWYDKTKGPGAPYEDAEGSY